MNEPAEVDRIRAEMARVRQDLHGNMDEVVQSARQLTDWRRLVRAHPWAAVGTAAVVGYVLAPRRRRKKAERRSAAIEVGGSDTSASPDAPSPPASRVRVATVYPWVNVAAGALLRGAAQLAGRYAMNRLAAAGGWPSSADQYASANGGDHGSPAKS